MKIFSLYKGWPVLYYLFIFGIYQYSPAVQARNPFRIYQTYQNHFNQVKVSGTVSDGKGPLPGVIITIKGTTTRTTTDFDGKYSLLADPEDILVYSFMGYKTRSIPIDGRTLINTQLQEDATAL
jgi:hypothetical protein